MTRKTHQALKAHEYPNIEYRLVSQSIITSKKGQFTGKIIGNITIAGVTKIISIPFSGILSGNKITISGTAGLNMNNFNIKPPTAMLGTVKTDTNITVTFHLLFHINR
jgi:polyisoprenoid-binding protein YceI